MKRFQQLLSLLLQYSALWYHTETASVATICIQSFRHSKVDRKGDTQTADRLSSRFKNKERRLKVVIYIFLSDVSRVFYSSVGTEKAVSTFGFQKLFLNVPVIPPTVLSLSFRNEKLQRKRLLVSLCLLSVCSHVTSRERLNVFSWNVIFESLTKIRR
jgi:hypothetical protein